MDRRVPHFARFIVIALLVQIGLVSSAMGKNGSAAEDSRDLFGPDCREYLIPEPKNSFDEKIHLVSQYQKFRIGRKSNDGGFFVVPKNPTRSPALLRRVNVMLREPLIRSEEWRDMQDEIYFVSTGFENLQNESFLINSEVAEQVLNYPGEALEINFSRKRAAEEKRLTTFRWSVHDAVLAEYAERKGYLTPEDQISLIAYNRDSTHNDVFALMYVPPMFLSDFSYQEIAPELAMTIQISYFGSRNYLAPSLKGVLAARGFGYFEGFDRLPFEYRLRPSDAMGFRAMFYTEFDPKTTCEMNRYMKVHEFHQQAFQSRLLLKAFLQAKSRGMKTIIASADSKTIVLFRRTMGFKLWKQMPVKGDEPEYLLYMKVDGPEYSRLVGKLALNSAQTRVDWRNGTPDPMD